MVIDPSVDPTLYPWTDWVDVLFDPAPIMDHTVGISGGNELARFNLSLNYFDQHGMVPNTGADRYGLRLNSDFNITEKLTAGLGAQFVDDRFSSANNHRVAPNYWTVDAMVAYQFNEHFDLRVNVYNLADEEYIDRVGGGHFIPGPGRSATVTAAFKF